MSPLLELCALSSTLDGKTSPLSAAWSSLNQQDAPCPHHSSGFKAQPCSEVPSPCFLEANQLTAEPREINSAKENELIKQPSAQCEDPPVFPLHPYSCCLDLARAKPSCQAGSRKRCACWATQYSQLTSGHWTSLAWQGSVGQVLGAHLEQSRARVRAGHPAQDLPLALPDPQAKAASSHHRGPWLPMPPL